MLSHVALVRTGVYEEIVASIVSVKTIRELGATLTVIKIRELAS
jgi:hypothetical protein